MKTVTLLDQAEFRTLLVLLHDAKINLEKYCSDSFYINETHQKIEEAIKILTEKA